MKKHDLSWGDLIAGGAAPSTAKAAKRFREVAGVDYLEAAESRIRQLQEHNSRLERQVRLLKTKLEEK